MAAYMISINYNPDEEEGFATKEDLIDKIKEIGRWIKVSEYLWFVDTNRIRSCKSIYEEYFMPIVEKEKKEYEIIICALIDYAGRFDRNITDWLDNHT